ncbi:MAG: hypothetical protein OXM01_11160 [Gemmatimonadota bacterium]|nr:hypothetical protein [Gemmatimonadota bacterium]
MIRVDLLDRQRRWFWSKALLSILVVCGGLYGIYQFSPALVRPLFNTGSDLISKAQQELAPKPTPSPAVQQKKSTPEPTEQQETTPSPVQETTPKPTEQQEKPIPSPVVQQETIPEPTAQRETTPSSIVQQETTPRPTPTPTPPQDPSSQRNTACHQVMRINEQVPAEIRVSSLICNSSGEYWLEGTSPSYKVLRMFRLSLQALPSQVSFSAWREERTLRFAFQGRFVDQDTPPLAPLSSSQAEQFFGKVARWADASGLDSLSIEEPTHRALSSARTHQRQKLRSIGSPQQIDAFLHHFQQAESVATLGEVLLMPVASDERGWVQARLYAAVDIIVDGP